MMMDKAMTRRQACSKTSMMDEHYNTRDETGSESEDTTTSVMSPAAVD
jgi:hypothetical protein